MPAKSVATVRRGSKSKSKNEAYDPLDAAGKHVNFVTGQPYSAAYREMTKLWSGLPMYRDLSKIREIVRSLSVARVTIIVSATGSGKSVCSPRLVMRSLVDEAKANAVEKRPPTITMTVPKQILASEAAAFAAKTWDVELGSGEVGYKYRGSPAGSHGPRNRVLYQTDGMLLQTSDPTFSAYDAVILDEAHERAWSTDILLSKLRQALSLRPDLRLVIMSATIDFRPYQHYFESAGHSTSVIELLGATTFPIERNWAPAAIPDAKVIEAGLEQVMKIVNQPPKVAAAPKILFFVPSSTDCTKGCKGFEKTCQTSTKSGGVSACKTTACLPLYRKQSDELKHQAIRPEVPKGSTRSVVIATNLAESSVTLKSLGYVIDSGLAFTSQWQPLQRSTRLARGFTSQAQILQRVGRVGRTAPGVVYHLYTQAQFDALPKYPTPSVLTEDLTEHMLGEMAKGNRLSKVAADFGGLLTPTKPEQVLSSASFLSFQGLILTTPIPPALTTAQAQEKALVTSLDGVVTDLGRNLAQLQQRFRVGVQGALLLLAGALIDTKSAREDALILAVVFEEMAGEASTLWSLDARENPRRILKDHCDAHSDHVSVVRIFREVALPGGRKARQGLHLAFWERVIDEVGRHSQAYSRFTIRLDAPLDARMSALMPTGPAWTPTLRMIAFARAHQRIISTDEKGSKVTNVHPLMRTVAGAQCTLASPPDARGRPSRDGVYESLLEGSRGTEFEMITWLPPGLPVIPGSSAAAPAAAVIPDVRKSKGTTTGSTKSLRNQTATRASKKGGKGGKGVRHT